MQKKQLKRLILCAVFTAMSVVLALIAKQIFSNGSFFRITFENMPIIFASIFFGPLYGLAMGVCVDLLTVAVTGGAINPAITVGAAFVGITAGVISRIMRTRGLNTRIICSCAGAHIVGNMIIKTVALQLMYKAGPAVLVRIPTYILIAVCESAVMIILMKNKFIRESIEELS